MSATFVDPSRCNRGYTSDVDGSKSGLIAAGSDVVTVQRALGHGSASVTLNTYGLLWPDANERTRQAARELYAQSVAYRRGKIWH